MDKKILSPKIAKEFALEIFSKINSESDREFRIFHARAVTETALALSNGDKAVDKEVLEMAGWLHDIGYGESEDKHAERGIEILEKENFILSDKIADCILNHDTFSTARTKEGKIMQMADKISFINPGILEILTKRNYGKLKKEELEFLDQALSEATDYLKMFANA